MTMSTAARMKLNRLYHYQQYDLTRLNAIVLEKKIRFSNPRSFNDPWDCKVWLNEDIQTDPSLIERYIEYYIRVTRKHAKHISDNEIEWKANYFRSNPNELKAIIPQISLAMNETIDARNRVYCLSTKPDCELMWAHYSNKHQGICLEFDAQNELFGLALKVSYREDYPLLDLSDDSVERVLTPFTTKSISWEYEDEFRIIAQEDKFDNSSGALTTKDNFAEFPDGALTAIILGCEAPDSIVFEVKKLIDQSAHPIELRKAVQARNQYKLEITSI